MQPAKNWAAKNVSSPRDGAKDWCDPPAEIERAGLVVVIHVRQEQVAKEALIDHDNMVDAFPADRAD
jgi:hypothetical protein